jgi:hypothetical protein
MPTTGKITKVTSKPRGFVLTVPASPGPPPTPEETLPFTPIDADDYAAAIAAKVSGCDAEVEGTSPNCGGVTLK